MPTISVDRVFTLNTKALKDLLLTDVLRLHPLLDAQALDYVVVQKTKPIKARATNTILDKSNNSVFEKMLLSTLEGSQDLKRDGFICWGIADDVWQQTVEKLHQQYTLESVDTDGWIHCVPKPDTPKNGCKIVDAEFGPCGGFSILSPWGDQRVLSAAALNEAGIAADEDKAVYLQYGVQNDWVLQNQSDLSDTYRVAVNFFDNTYDIQQPTASD